MKRPLTVAWFSFFPVEWLPDAPPEIRALPRLHPASWQRVLLGELEKRADLRLHILVVRKQFPRSFSFERNGVTFHLLKSWAGLRAPSLFWLDTLLIRRVLRRVQPDVAHAWGTENGAALVASRLGYPHLVSVQGLLSWYREVVPASAHDRLAAWLERRSLPRAPLVTAESQFSADYVRRHFKPACVRQIEHTPDWMFHRIPRAPGPGRSRLLTLGPLVERKGADLLLAGLERLSRELDFELTVIGGTAEALPRELRSRLAPELLRRLVFKGRLPQAEVAAELARATLMLCPTRADTGPMAVKEAVVSGVPVVGSAVGGIPDYVVHGKNGLLFESGQLEAFVRAVREAAGHPMFARGEVDATTLRVKRDHLSPTRMADDFLDAYRQSVSIAGGGSVAPEAGRGNQPDCGARDKAS